VLAVSQTDRRSTLPFVFPRLLFLEFGLQMVPIQAKRDARSPNDNDWGNNMDARKKTADLPGGPLTYRETGAGDVIVFLHGLAGNSLSWVGQFERFSRDHRCIAWDAPGYGGSALVEADADRFAETLAQLFDHCAVEKATLVGHSMGGIVAARFAGRHPDRVERLVLSCTHWGGCQPKGSGLSDNYRERLQTFDRGGPREYGLERAKNMLSPDAPADVFDLIAEIASRCNRDGVEAAARMINETDNRDLLAELNCPVSVLIGEVDPVVARERTDDLAAAIPGARAIVISGAGHAPYLEKSAEFNAALAA